MPESIMSADIRHGDALNAAKTRLLTIIARGATLHETLNALCQEYETLVPGSLCSLMLPDPADPRMLRAVSGPNLPKDYLTAIDGHPHGPRAGSCGSAFSLRQRIIAEDVETDPHWADYRDFARSFGLRSCWSTPILTEGDGPPLGVFGIYRLVPHAPASWEQFVADHFVAVAAIAIQRDHTESALRQAKFEADRANAAKSAFLANMSHELRTPLNAVLGFAELISLETLGPLVPSAYRNYADHILASGRYLLALIDDILDVARIESGRVTLAEETVELRPLVDDCIAILRQGAQPSYEAAVQNAVATGVRLSADRRSLTQILLNLIDNALKFTPVGGTVHIETLLHEDGLTLLVRDTGIGIPADRLSELGLPFVQVATALSRTHKGSGLGLFIAKSLTALHGGTLSMNSTMGKGTTVRVDLPQNRLIAA
jgi:signal transduction histidine kinase